MKPTKTYSIQEAAAAFLAGKRIEGTTRIGNPFALGDFAIGGKRKYRFRNPRATNPSFDTPEAALEWVAATLPHITLTVLDPLPLGTVGTVSPPPAPLVPLGPNKTRDGREARVICIDRVCPGNVTPVAALITLTENEETLRYYRNDGKFTDKETPLDLVGHLPPEPAKPREFWINLYRGGGLAAHPSAEHAEGGKYGALKTPVETIVTREVLPDQDDELEHLRKWKRQAIQACNGHPCGNDILALLKP